MATPESELVKLQVCLYKKDGTPYEEFVKFVTEEYPKNAIPLMKKYGLVKWSITVLPPAMREHQREVLKHLVRPDWTVPDYDIVMSYYLRSMDDMMALVSCPEWPEIEKEALELSNVRIGHLVAGHEIVQFENNETRRSEAKSQEMHAVCGSEHSASNLEY